VHGFAQFVVDGVGDGTAREEREHGVYGIGAIGGDDIGLVDAIE